MPKSKSRAISPRQPSLPGTPPPELKGPKKATETPPPPKKERHGGELFIVDNSDEQWKVAQYLDAWCDVARAFDVATGYFEIGALLALDGRWQNLERIRILMGDEVSKRTQQAFVEALGRVAATLNESIEREKEKNDFLVGVPAIGAALERGKIQCRVYRERKFHAKAYITHSKFDVMGATALVGSSNFTFPGLHENVELNVRLRSEVETLQAWYEKYWNEAEEVTPEILRVIEPHVREYSPFEVYAKALYEFEKGHEVTAGEWEKTQSQMFRVLDYYQVEGYAALLKKAIARGYRGALLCDSVGLGKTFIGLMLIERLLFDRKRIALLVPKAARDAVWENKLNHYLPDLIGAYSNLAIYNHSDLLRGGKFPRLMNEVREKADVIIIDEAHHFRTLSAKTYKKLYELAEGKTLFLLTATPINNSLLDLQHMIELFSRKQPDYFKQIGVHSLTGHFRRLENAVEKLLGDSDVPAEITTAEAEQVLAKDELFRELVVQRSRAYAKESQKQHGGRAVVFPERKPPQVAPYSLEKTYGKLLDDVERAFKRDKPLLSLAIYYPLGYAVKPVESVDEKWVEGRQRQVVGLIRTQLLKRFESSARAFERTCEEWLGKLWDFALQHSETPAEKRRLERWQNQHAELLARVRAHRAEIGEEETDEDVTRLEFEPDAEKLSRAEYKVDEILDETFLDLEQLAKFLEELQDFSAAQDDKLQSLITLLQTDPRLNKHKVLIFTEYMDTARYLADALRAAGIAPLDEVDSAVGRNRQDIIKSFSPYYNDSPSAQLAAEGKMETRVLISTDVLSEGLNLQDATLLINYDLHWNPVRLMQRIGRVDRRLDPEVEARMIADHLERKDARGVVHYWNFLPPHELDRLLSLYARVAHKTLRISKVFGIEGKKLLKPEDDFDALKEFNEEYEGAPSEQEAMSLEYRQLLADNPGLEEKLARFPQRVFSARAHPHKGKQAVFFCYALPAKNLATGEWSTDAGHAQWYLYDVQSENVLEGATRINAVIRSAPATPRRAVLTRETLVEIRKKVERQIANSYLRAVQAPVGVKAVLKAWMELN